MVNVSIFAQVLESRLKKGEVVWNEDGKILQVKINFKNGNVFSSNSLTMGLKAN